MNREQILKDNAEFMKRVHPDYVCNKDGNYVKAEVYCYQGQMPIQYSITGEERLEGTQGIAVCALAVVIVMTIVFFVGIIL